MNYGQWGEELVAELHAQMELAQDALCLLWAPRWVTLLPKRLLWDPSRRPSAEKSIDASILVRGRGEPTAVEGEIFPGFPGAAVP